MGSIFQDRTERKTGLARQVGSDTSGISTAEGFLISKVSIAIFFLTIATMGWAITLPIDEPYLKKKFGRILLDGWYAQIRSVGGGGQERQHKALDFSAALNTPARAVEYGQVIEINFDYPKVNEGVWRSGYGNYIKVRNKKDEVWVYAHLTSYSPKINEWVSEGQVIGSVGSTGLVDKTGKQLFKSHLHLEKRDKDDKKIFFTKDFGVQFALSK